MGTPMAQRLLAAGIPVIAYNRTASKLELLKQAGVEIAETPQEVIKKADCLILMLTNFQAIQEVLLINSKNSGLSNKIVVQMGTISPSESRAISQEVESLGGSYLEAPVLGSIPEAKAGTLLLMVGSSPEHYQQWKPLFSHFGSDPLYVGEVGTAAALKLALNQLITGLTSSFALSLGFVQQQGVEVEKFMGILRQSALYAPTFDKKLSRMVEGNYENPNFPTKHLLKDTNLFLGEAESAGLDVSALAGMQRILNKAIAMGLADTDYSALFAAIQTPADS